VLSPTGLVTSISVDVQSQSQFVRFQTGPLQAAGGGPLSGQPNLHSQSVVEHSCSLLV